MKTAVVIVSGAPRSDNLREIEIQPGTSAGDVLRALNLTGYLLSKEGSAQAFAEEEDIYSAINDGDKLRATPVAEVGAGFWESILQSLGLVNPPVQIPTSDQRVVTVQIVSGGVKVLPPKAEHAQSGRQIQIERDRRSLTEVRGWKRDGNRLIGAYRTPRGSFVGEISLTHPSNPEFFILNPPESLLTGRHASCFRKRNSGKQGDRYFVHFGLSNPDIDAGIVAIEKLIAQALVKK